MVIPADILNARILVVDDQDFAVKDVICADHANHIALLALIRVFANSSATSIVSMNSLILTGLVM